MEKDERWKELCALAAKEQDPSKLIKLIEEINRILEEQEAKRIKLNSSVQSDQQ